MFIAASLFADFTSIILANSKQQNAQKLRKSPKKYNTYDDVFLIILEDTTGK